MLFKQYNKHQGNMENVLYLYEHYLNKSDDK